jgi:hypothetical protein
LREQVSDLPQSIVGREIINQLNATYPATFEDITIQQLSTVYSQFYQGFLGWYNQFFGQQSLLNIKTISITDGDEELTAFNISAGGFDTTFVTDVSLDGFGYALQEIADWVQVRFGNIILQNSCQLCQSLGGNATDNSTDVPPGSGSGDNSTDDEPVDQFFTMENYTAPSGCFKSSTDGNKWCCTDDSQNAACYTLV